MDRELPPPNSYLLWRPSVRVFGLTEAIQVRLEPKQRTPLRPIHMGPDEIELYLRERLRQRVKVRLFQTL